MGPEAIVSVVVERSSAGAREHECTREQRHESARESLTVEARQIGSHERESGGLRKCRYARALKSSRIFAAMGYAKSKS